MKPDYEVYNEYNPKAIIEITVHNFLLKALGRLNTMLEFLENNHEDILESFKVEMITFLKKGIEKSDLGNLINQFKKTISELPLLEKHSQLGDLALHFVLSQLNIQTLGEEKTRVLYLDAEKADNLIPYASIKTLELLKGRDAGIQLYKDYVELMAKNAPPRELDGFKDMRTGMARMGKSGGFKYAIHDIDENMFLGKFDECVVYDSLKNMDDHELAYYVTCYTGMTIGNRRDWCVRMRRTQTLFSGDFCDELYWNREVHNGPKQPSLEFTRRMVIE